MSVRPTNIKWTYGIFTANFCSVLLPSSLHPHPQLSGGKGGYNISCSDIRYFQLRISVNTLPHCSCILDPQILGLAWITMNYLYKTTFFEEIPEDNFKAKTISVE